MIYNRFFIFQSGMLDADIWDGDEANEQKGIKGN